MLIPGKKNEISEKEQKGHMLNNIYSNLIRIYLNQDVSECEVLWDAIP